jgi:hypothetical protein
VGGEKLDDAVRRVAILSRAVKGARNTLDKYYQTLPSTGEPPSFTGGPPSKKRRTMLPPPAFPSAVDACFIGPHFNRYSTGGQMFMLTYIKRFIPNEPSKTVFLAKATCLDTGNTQDVVVKFSMTYGSFGHCLLANARPKALAPALYYCEKDENVGNLWIINMEYIPGSITTKFTPSHLNDIEAALNILHSGNLVFGDLRKANVLCLPNGAKLVDFDWCGKEGQVAYPPSINMRMVTKLSTGMVEWGGESKSVRSMTYI